MSLQNDTVYLALRRVQARPDLTDHAGICWQLGQALGDTYEARDASDDWLRDAFTALGLDLLFPVPHPTLADSEAAYFHVGRAGRLSPKWTGKYGANRHYLLALLIALAGGADPASIQVDWPFPYKPKRARA